MKNKISIILLLFFVKLAFSAPVSIETAKLVAQNYYLQVHKLANKSDVNLQLASEEKCLINNANLIPAFYIFNVENEGGFMIISADDQVTPILGYTNEGSYDAENMPPSFSKLFFEFKKGISQIVEQQLAADESIKIQWQSYKTGQSNSIYALEVLPLTKTNWSQRPNYNVYCPEGSPTGCVATAVGQILKYYNHPITGSGYHAYNHTKYGTLSANFGNTTYDWANMPEKVVYVSPQSQKEAISLLLYHIGIALDMDYSPTGSGAFTTKVPNVLKTYFKYKSGAQLISRGSFSLNTWKQKIKAELDLARVVYHSGFCPNPEAGHAFVVDGYDKNDLFHINWGWGGSYNGYFQINNLNPGTTYTWNQSQSAIIKIIPNGQTYQLNLAANIFPVNDSLPNFNNTLISNHASINQNALTFDTTKVVDSTYVTTQLSLSKDLTVFAYVENKGNLNFTGKFIALVINENDLVLDTLQIIDSVTVNAFDKKTIAFYNNGLSLFSGKYKIAVYYGDNNDLNLLNQVKYKNPILVIHQNDTATNPSVPKTLIPFEATVVNPNPLEKNKAAKVIITLKNNDVIDFYGKISVDYHQQNSDWIDELGSLSAVSIAAGEVKTLTLNTSKVTLAPGSYKLAIWKQANGGSWKVLDNGYQPSIIDVNVVQLDFSSFADVYENNNDISTPYQLSLPSFNEENKAVITTNGSNIHEKGDRDFYSIQLEKGYSYSVKAKIFDNCNSDGKNLTNDVLFKYHTENNETSEFFDDVEMPSYELSNGGQLIFNVIPFYSQLIGSYEMEITVTKLGTSSVNNLDNPSNLNVYPNPANQEITIDFQDNTLSSILIYNSIGELVKVTNKIGYNRNKIDVSDLKNGIYFIHLASEKETITKKLTINR